MSSRPNKIIRDSIGWDIVNWSKSINYLNKNLDLKNINEALELGGGENSGGYSLFFSFKK